MSGCARVDFVCLSLSYFLMVLYLLQGCTYVKYDASFFFSFR